MESKPKFINSLRKTRIVVPGACCTLTLLLYCVGILQSQVPPPGQSGGNVTPCLCECTVVPNTEVRESTPCGPECGNVAIVSQAAYDDTFVVEDTDCFSGLRSYRQPMMITTVSRSTSHEGKLTRQCRRTVPNVGTNAGVDTDCSGCPPCPPLVETYECGKISVLCESTPNDTTTEFSGPPVKGACLESHT
jgi:hypothetical protein